MLETQGTDFFFFFLTPMGQYVVIIKPYLQQWSNEKFEKLFRQSRRSATTEAATEEQTGFCSNGGGFVTQVLHYSFTNGIQRSGQEYSINSLC